MSHNSADEVEICSNMISSPEKPITQEESTIIEQTQGAIQSLVMGMEECSMAANDLETGKTDTANSVQDGNPSQDLNSVQDVNSVQDGETSQDAITGPVLAMEENSLGKEMKSSISEGEDSQTGPGRNLPVDISTPPINDEIKGEDPQDAKDATSNGHDFGEKKIEPTVGEERNDYKEVNPASPSGRGGFWAGPGTPWIPSEESRAEPTRLCGLSVNNDVEENTCHPSTKGPSTSALRPPSPQGDDGRLWYPPKRANRVATPPRQPRATIRFTTPPSQLRATFREAGDGRQWYPPPRASRQPGRTPSRDGDGRPWMPPPPPTMGYPEFLRGYRVFRHQRTHFGPSWIVPPMNPQAGPFRIWLPASNVPVNASRFCVPPPPPVWARPLHLWGPPPTIPSAGPGFIWMPAPVDESTGINQAWVPPPGSAQAGVGPEEEPGEDDESYPTEQPDEGLPGGLHCPRGGEGQEPGCEAQEPECEAQEPECEAQAGADRARVRGYWAGPGTPWVPAGEDNAAPCSGRWALPPYPLPGDKIKCRGHLE